MKDRIDAKTRLISLIAHPIRHSLSPTMHNEAIVKLGLNYSYLAFEVGEKRLPGAVQGMRDLGIVGSNVSMPNKQAIIPLLDDISEEAKTIGAVNTVVNEDPDGKGFLVGYNTDGTGCMRALSEYGFPVENQIVTLTGAGGAGTAVSIQAAFDGAKEIRIFNRDDDHKETAIENVEKINAQSNTKATFTSLEDTDAFYQSIAESSIYIDATSAGMKPLEDVSLINNSNVIREDLVIYDVVYSPTETKLLRFARENGAKYAYNGLAMMLYQGAEAFKLFTGEDMPVEYIKELLFDEE